MHKKKYVTLKDVAGLANASLASVSAVLSGSDKRYVSPTLRKRILSAAEELNYVKSSMASGLRGVSQRVIALLVPQFDNSYFIRLAISVERVARENDYTITICDTHDDPEREKQIIETVIGHRVDGIIVAPTLSGAENTEIIRRYDLPYVAVDRPLNIVEGYDFVTSDNYQAGAISARCFLAHGHRHFGYIGWKSRIPIITDRLRGFQEVVSPSADFFDYRIAEKLDPKYGYEYTEELFNNGKTITALLYGHHNFAQGGIEFFRERGIQIPEELSVIMIGSPSWVPMVQPRFTCVHQPVEEMGAMAAQVLLEKINGSHNFIETRMLQHSIMEGETVIDATARYKVLQSVT